jgi:hypothetical protein
MASTTGYEGPRPFRINAVVTSRLTAVELVQQARDFVGEGISHERLLTGEFLGDRMDASKGVQKMKKSRSIVHSLSLACACLIGAGCASQPGAATAQPPNSGHVLIYRVPNFGSNLSLVVSVDGKDVGSFTEGRNYEGYLLAGQHELTARVDPNQTGVSPGRKTLNVVAGQTYSYTAAWFGGNLKLVRNP